MARGSTGTLVLQHGRLMVERLAKKGGMTPSRIVRGGLAADLESLPVEECIGIEVDFEFDNSGSAVTKVRRAGQPWTGPTQPPTQPTPRRRDPARERARSSRPPKRPQGDFHNPYNFVPALPRAMNADLDLGDREPRHDRLQPDDWEGVLEVKMTVCTPLLVPDTGKVEAIETAKKGKPHQVFPLRVDANGEPHLAVTGIKGMLRSAHEAATNSRMGIFVGHDRPVGFRQTTGIGVRMVPARVVQRDGDLQLELLPGTTQPRPEGPGMEREQYGAWLPAYGPVRAVRYTDGAAPRHGDHVVAVITPQRHHRRNFRYWLVEAVAPVGSAEAERLTQDDDRKIVTGWVFRTNENATNKKYERIFFRDPALAPEYHSLAPLQQGWNDIMRSYKEAQRTPEQTKSAHLIEDGRRELREGSLCYVLLDERSPAPVGVFPVQIGRQPFDCSPDELLHPSIHPADAPGKCSSSDRLFGWVHPSGRGAVRGQVRITPPRCEQGADAVECFDELAPNGLPLAILSQPKPAQVRFYGAADELGNPHEDGWPKGQRGYKQGEGLRGRKVYTYDPGLPREYWDEPWEDRTQDAENERFQEYRRPDKEGRPQRDDQNRSMRGWVKPGSTFTFKVYVRNAGAADLGALLWLLTLEDGHVLRFGGGKPLGFGCVRLELDLTRSRLATGSEVANAYGEVLPLPGDGAERVRTAVESLVGDYKKAVIDAEIAAGREASLFQDVPYIAAFLAVARGVGTGLPTHYPRARQAGQPDPVGSHVEGLSYQWFVANERRGRFALLDAADDRGLPMLDTR